MQKCYWCRWAALWLSDCILVKPYDFINHKYFENWCNFTCMQLGFWCLIATKRIGNIVLMKTWIPTDLRTVFVGDSSIRDGLMACIALGWDSNGCWMGSFICTHQFSTSQEIWTWSFQTWVTEFCLYRWESWRKYTIHCYTIEASIRQEVVHVIKKCHKNLSPTEIIFFLHWPKVQLHCSFFDVCKLCPLINPVLNLSIISWR